MEHGYEVGGVFCLSGFGVRVFFADVGVFCATHFPAVGVARFHNHDFTVGHLHFQLLNHTLQRRNHGACGGVVGRVVTQTHNVVVEPEFLCAHTEELARIAVV